MARNTFTKSLLIATTALFLLVGVAAVLLFDEPSPSSAQSTAVTGDSSAQVAGARTGLAQSSDKVRLRVDDDEAGGLAGDEIVLTLDIDAGWHVNANPASIEFLIPTAASATANGQTLDIPVQYPAGRVSDITLGDTAIEVYDDGASIRLLPEENDIAVLEKAGGLDLKVRVQACSDNGVCLAPSDLAVTLSPAGTDAH